MSDTNITDQQSENTSENPRTANKKRILIIAGSGIAVAVLALVGILSMNMSVSSAKALENYKAAMKPFENRTTELVNEVNDLRGQGIGDSSFGAVISGVAEEWNQLSEEVALVDTPTPEIAEAHAFFTKYMEQMGKAYGYFAIGLETSDVEMIYLGNDFQDDASGTILQYAASISLLESQESQKNE